MMQLVLMTICDDTDIRNAVKEYSGCKHL